jgi:hypothetical protein
MLIGFKILFLNIVSYADTSNTDPLKKTVTSKSLENIATGGIPKEAFLGIVLFMLLIFILLLIIRTQSADKNKGI